VKQLVRVSIGAEIKYRYPDGSAAIVRATLGKGTVEYAACGLEVRSYSRFLDDLLDRAGVPRSIRVRGSGDDHWRVEARYAQSGSRRLLYVVNFNPDPVQLRVEAGAEAFTALRELRDNTVISGSDITIPGRQTAIYELF
jgi:hypothetical protein